MGSQQLTSKSTTPTSRFINLQLWYLLSYFFLLPCLLEQMLATKLKHSRVNVNILMENISPDATKLTRTYVWLSRTLVKKHVNHQIPVLATISETMSALFFRHLYRLPRAQLVTLLRRPNTMASIMYHHQWRKHRRILWIYFLNFDPRHLRSVTQKLIEKATLRPRKDEDQHTPTWYENPSGQKNPNIYQTTIK